MLQFFPDIIKRLFMNWQKNYSPQEKALSLVFVHAPSSLFLGLPFWVGEEEGGLLMSSSIFAFFAELLPPLPPLLLLLARLMAGDTLTYRFEGW